MNLLTNEYIVKIVGEASLPEPLENGEDYELRLSGGVTSKTEKPNFDGTQDVVFKLKLLSAEITDKKGKSMKSLDRRSNSKKLRACIYHLYENVDAKGEFEEFYDGFYGKLLANFDGIVEYMRGIK